VSLCYVDSKESEGIRDMSCLSPFNRKTDRDIGSSSVVTVHSCGQEIKGPPMLFGIQCCALILELKEVNTSQNRIWRSLMMAYNTNRLDLCKTLSPPVIL
jgi:hypothetical protein